MSIFEKRKDRRKEKRKTSLREEELVGRPVRPALKLITFQACVLSSLLPGQVAWPFGAHS